MSLAKLTLRPPPNIDFVQGYPGIPPSGADRPQAAVKGAIEVRVAAQGVKAKWVRIELKKVEVLPGGSTFYDYVGQSPIIVWQANEDYATLHTQDFPFYIRIPESIPPSIALEKGAGIRYELIAAVCLKGKRGLFRRDKPTITTTSSTIIIDKHELHSTWPIYQQSEARSHTDGDVTLIVERARTCYGPGDRVTVGATVKADKSHKGILRGFEFTLRETTVFRAGPHTTGKKSAPVVKVAHIAEQKVPVNITLYGGTQHKADLFVVIPSQHTSATLNTARHIDITYTIVVKAHIGTEQHVTLDLPVIVSNWPRAVSLEAMRRIGLAPNVSVPGQTVPSSAASSSSSALIGQPILSSPPRPGTAQSTRSQADVVIGRSTTGQYNTAPMEKTNGIAGIVKPDEFGVTRTADQESNVSSVERSNSLNAQTIGGTSGLAGAGSARIAPYANETTAFVRPRVGSARAANQRLTATNFTEAELAEHREAEKANTSRTQGNSSSASRITTAPTQNASRSRWMSAEEEKRRLYETAVANVERVQGIPPPRPQSPVESIARSTPTTPPADVVTTPIPTTNAVPKPKNRWLTAEEEKARLFETAQAAVARAQGLDGSITSSPPASIHGRSESGASHSPMSTPPLRAQVEPTPGPAPRTPPPGQSSSAQHTSSKPQTPPSVRNRVPMYQSAEEEKAAMRRFYEAKAAVDRTHENAFGLSPQTPTAAPMPYDALYPLNAATPPPAGGSPPHLVPSSSSSQPHYLSEKERLRREYEARDAAAMTTPPALPVMSPVLNASTSPPPTSSAAAEKEMLRRKFEAQDAATRASSGPPTPPPRSGSFSARPIPTPPRSPPVPPVAGGSRPITAAEEKARLKAMYEAEDRMGQPNGVAPSPSPMENGTAVSYGAAFVPPPAPPPLAPKPPKEYIQETQDEDMRTHARLQAIDKEISAVVPQKTEVILSSFSADLVDANGDAIPAPGPPPPVRQPTD